MHQGAAHRTPMAASPPAITSRGLHFRRRSKWYGTSVLSCMVVTPVHRLSHALKVRGALDQARLFPHTKSQPGPCLRPLKHRLCRRTRVRCGSVYSSRIISPLGVALRRQWPGSHQGFISVLTRRPVLRGVSLASLPSNYVVQTSQD